MEDKLNLILKKLEKLDIIEKKFENLEEGQKTLKTGQAELKDRVGNLETGQQGFRDRFDHLEKIVHKNYFALEAKIDARFEEMDKKQDKILSTVQDFVIRTDKNEDEIAVTAHQARGHEDRITELEEKIT